MSDKTNPPSKKNYTKKEKYNPLIHVLLGMRSLTTQPIQISEGGGGEDNLTRK